MYHRSQILVLGLLLRCCYIESVLTTIQHRIRLLVEADKRVCTAPFPGVMKLASAVYHLLKNEFTLYNSKSPRNETHRCLTP